MIHIKDQQLIQAIGLKIRIRLLRNSKGFSQEQLAFIAGIPISQVGRIERAEVNPTISSLSALAKALDIDLSELVRVEL